MTSHVRPIPKALIGDRSVDPLGHPFEPHTYPLLQLSHPFHCINADDCKRPALEREGLLKPPTKLVACSPDQIQEVLNHAHVVSDANSPWSALSLQERHEILKEAAAAVDAEKELYAKMDVLETGIPLPVQYQIVEGLAPVALESMEKAINDVLGCKQKVPSRFGGNIIGKRRPISPALILAPWNVPNGTIVPKLFVALLCGCKVVVKPSEYAPSSMTQMIHTIHSVIFGKYKIPNVLQLVQGGGVVGATLVGSKEIQCVQFTGAPKTAGLVAQQCAPLLKPLLAECGGSNALIICKDASLTAACRYAAMGCLTLNGQWCVSQSRVLVHKSVKDDFLKFLKLYMEKRVRLMTTAEDMEGVSMKQKQEASSFTSTSAPTSSEEFVVKQDDDEDDEDEDDEKTKKNQVFLELGPLASEAHAKSIRHIIEELSASSSIAEPEKRIVKLFDVQKVWNQHFKNDDASHNTNDNHCCCKEIPASYLSPQCIMEPDPALAARRELFGPVFSLHTFETEEEAIRITNLSTGMLACFVFSKDVDRAQKIGLQLRTGMSMVNSTNFGFEPADPSMGGIEADFWGSAGSGSDGTGAAAAKFFSKMTWAGVAGSQDHQGHEIQ